MKKNYTADFGLVKIADDMDYTIELVIGAENYTAIKYGDTYTCRQMEGGSCIQSHNISEETDYYPKNKLDAINMILRYAGTYTYQTLVKKGNVA